VVHAVPEADDRERELDLLAPPGPVQVREEKRELDVLVGRQDRNEVVELEDEADVRAPPLCERRLAHSRDLGFTDEDAPRRRAVDPGDEVQERRLAGPRRAHERDKVPFLDGQRELVEDGEDLRVARVLLDERVDLDEGGRHTALLRVRGISPS
jgi:hypothetical protein